MNARQGILGSLVFISTALADPPPVHVYLGNLHSHTSYSDGQGTPEQAFTYARDTAKLDFLAVTEHNHLIGGDKATPAQRIALYVGPDKTALVPTAKRMTVDGKFVAMAGQEFSTMSKGNHVNVFDVDAVIDVPSGDFAGLLKWMAAHPDSTGTTPVLQLNHPALGGPPNKRIGPKEYGRDDFGGDAGWIKSIGGAATLIEILNGEPPAAYIGTRSPQIMEDFFQRYLQLGFHLAPTGDQDNHRMDWGTASQSRTGIVAPALTTKDLVEAMRARHVYATEDRNLRVIFRVNGQLCGDIFPKAPGAVTVDYSLADDDEPAAEYAIEAFRGTIGGPLAQVVKTVPAKGNVAAGRIDGLSLDQPGQYLYFRITQTGTLPDRVWIAPVWVEGGQPPASVDAALAADTPAPGPVVAPMSPAPSTPAAGN